MSELVSYVCLVHDLPFEGAVNPYLDDVTAYTDSWARRPGMLDLVGSASWGTSRDASRVVLPTNHGIPITDSVGRARRCIADRLADYQQFGRYSAVADQP
jgi:hypothetical protein